MGARRIEMHRLQEVMRLYRLGRSRREISQQLRIGRNTIRRYLNAISKAGMLDGPVDELPETDVPPDDRRRAHGLEGAAAADVFGGALEGRDRAPSARGRGADGHP